MRVTFRGDLDVYRKDEIAANLPPPSPAVRVLIDCSGVELIDSSILGIFMRYRRLYAEAGGDPLNIVVIAEPSARRIFEIAGLAKSITIISAAPSVDAKAQDSTAVSEA